MEYHTALVQKRDEILLVERDARLRTQLEIALGELAVVESASSGQAALMRMGMTDYACIVVGSPIPVDFGDETFTLIELLERMAPNLAGRVVVLTSVEETAVLARALDLGVYAIFVQPFDVADVCDAVSRCVRHDAPPRPVHRTAEGRDRPTGGLPTG